MSIDEFNNPKVYADERAIMMLITRLVLLNPGTIQSHPAMGVGLVENYRYAMEGEEVKLRSAIIEQISKFLPQLQAADVQVEFNNNTFYIGVTIDNTVFMVMYDIDNANIDTKYAKLSDL